MSSVIQRPSMFLMELDKGAAKQALMDKVKADANLYTRFRASQAFTDLDAEIKKIEDAKKAGTTPPQYEL